MTSIIHYNQIVQIEKMNLQKGMNFRCNPNYSVLLMSTRDGAPFEDEIAADGRVLIYEGHNIYKHFLKLKIEQYLILQQSFAYERLLVVHEFLCKKKLL